MFSVSDMEDERLGEEAHVFAALLQEGAIKENVDALFMGFTETEAGKKCRERAVSVGKGKNVQIPLRSHLKMCYNDVMECNKWRWNMIE